MVALVVLGMARGWTLLWLGEVSWQGEMGLVAAVVEVGWTVEGAHISSPWLAANQGLLVQPGSLLPPASLQEPGRNLRYQR